MAKFIDILTEKPKTGVRFLAKIKDSSDGKIDYEVAEICEGDGIFTSRCGYCGTDDITDKVVSWVYIDES